MARIGSLHLHHFRNIEQAQLELSPAANVIVGDNAAGKTAIIEAIWTLASGRSFRTHKPQQLIQTDQNMLTLFCQVEHQGQAHKLGLSRDTQNSGLQLKIDAQAVKSQSELARLLPVQLLTPESHRLLEEGPKARRQFIDWGCFHHHSEFISAWRHYQRALKQRNHSLKQRHARNQIQLWDQILIESADKINALRAAYLDHLAPHIEYFCRFLMPKLDPALSIKFHPGWPHRFENYQQALQSNIHKDEQQGHTQYGAHRADLRIKIKQQEPLVSLSRGQQKLFVCALLLAQAYYLQQQTQEALIMLIDDLPAELDATHRHTLLSLLDELKIQHLVTTTSLELIPNINPDTRRIFTIQQGQISLRQD